MALRIVETVDGLVEFEMLRWGDTFRNGPVVYIKTPEATSEDGFHFNSVALDSGAVAWQEEESLIEPVELIAEVRPVKLL